MQLWVDCAHVSIVCRLFALHLRGFSGVVPSFVLSSVGYETYEVCECVRASDANVAVCRTFQSLLYLALHFTKTQT